MRYGKKRKLEGPYETLSDIAIGSLGVFVILVVVLVIISTRHSSDISNVYENIKKENDRVEAGIITVRKESKNYKSNDYAKKEIRQLRKEYDKTKRKLNRTIEKLNLEKERLQSKKTEFEEVASVLNVIEEKRKEKADFVFKRDQLIQLKSLLDKNTGNAADRSGGPYLEYGTFTPKYYSTTKDTLYLIGKEAVIRKNIFFDLMKSFQLTVKDSFVIAFSNDNSNYSQDSYKQQWTKNWHKKNGWIPSKRQRKEGH